MLRVHLFCEDFAHRSFVESLLRRLEEESGVDINLRTFRATGGEGRVMKSLRDYIHSLRGGLYPLPDLIIVARDANCRGINATQQELASELGEYENFAVLAIPDPHIERWLLLDSAAFKEVLGTGCQAPDQKCERERYKKLLTDAVLDSGLIPQIGGIEHAEEIVQAMNLERMLTADNSLGSLIGDLRQQFSQWQTE